MNILQWIGRVARKSRHARSIFYRPRHRSAWREVHLARQQAYERLVATLDDLMTLQAG